MFSKLAALVLPLTALLQVVTGVEYSTALGAGSIFSDVMTIKISYYRAKSLANPVEWDNDLQNKAIQQAVQCGLEYDVGLLVLLRRRSDANHAVVFRS